MKTKEAIEWIEDLIDDYSEVEGNESIVDDFRKVISLLQQGEKYRQMWEEISQGRRYALIEFDNEGYEKKGTKSFKEIEQKYFPKEEIIIKKGGEK
jgi:hypothetical protein